MLDLNAMRAEFAAYLTDNFHKSKSLDAALMHVLTRAYEQGLADGATVQVAPLFGGRYTLLYGSPTA